MFIDALLDQLKKIISYLNSYTETHKKQLFRGVLIMYVG